MKIDLKARKTEADWIRAVDKFAFTATPRWFEWLGWVLIMGAIAFLAKETGSVAVYTILGISSVLLALYFFNFFHQFELENFLFITNPNTSRIVSLVVTGLLGSGMWYLFNAVIRVLRETGT